MHGVQHRGCDLCSSYWQLHRHGEQTSVDSQKPSKHCKPEPQAHTRVPVAVPKRAADLAELAIPEVGRRSTQAVAVVVVAGVDASPNGLRNVLAAVPAHLR